MLGIGNFESIIILRKLLSVFQFIFQNLRETGKYNQIIAAQLDVIKTILTVEADASIFRASQCLEQTASEESALLEGVRTGILSCMANEI